MSSSQFTEGLMPCGIHNFHPLCLLHRAYHNDISDRQLTFKTMLSNFHVGPFGQGGICRFFPIICPFKTTSYDINDVGPRKIKKSI